jgi:predicted dehydrogenase
MGISIGLVGLGSFGACFAPLFKNHPWVDRIGFCDVESDRVARFFHDPFYARKIRAADCYVSLDAICKADFDALVIITQPWLHAPQCIQALESGKDVYSAVPVISIPDDDQTLDWCDRQGDPYFADSAFSNEMALFKMRNGATVRICEMRETPGCPGADSETFRVFGTHGSFSENRWWTIRRPDFAAIDLKHLPKPTCQALTDPEMFDKLPPEVEHAFKQVANPSLSDAELKETDFRPGGHGGSHPYLVHEFVSAVLERRRPAINVWEAVRYMAMGVTAHQSALKDGETLTVPDWGDPV